jgi:hypothetical protein
VSDIIVMQMKSFKETSHTLPFTLLELWHIKIIILLNSWVMFWKPILCFQQILGIELSVVYRNVIFPNIKSVCAIWNLVKNTIWKTPFKSAKISGNTTDNTSFNSRVRTLFQHSKKSEDPP